MIIKCHLFSYGSRALSKDKSIYKSKSSAKSSNWWEGEDVDEEDEEEDEDEVEFNPNFEVNEEDEKKMKEVEEQLKNMNKKRTLDELLEEDKHRKLIAAEHEEKFFLSTEAQRDFDEDWKKNGHFDGSFVGNKFWLNWKCLHKGILESTKSFLQKLT